MTVLTGILIGLATGLVFGFVLEKSRVFEPGIIVGQMQLRSFIMLKVFLVAVITGLLVLAVMHGVFGVKLSLKPLVWKADIIGGLVLGAGIALAGACPGTSLAQVGAGYRDAIFVVLGGLAGAIAYGYFDAPIAAFFAEKGANLTFAGLAGLPFWMVAVGFAAVLALMLLALERFVPWRSEIGADVDGVLPHEPAEPHVADGRTHRA